jgi:spore maturation protein CgeB
MDKSQLQCFPQESMLKILLHGEPLVRATGSWCYAETLKEMGHVVIPHHYYEGMDAYGHSLWWRALKKLNNQLPLERHRMKHIEGLYTKAIESKVDIIIISKGVFFSFEDIMRLRSTGAWVVNINHDDFFSRHSSNHSAIQRGALPAYDYIFTTREVNVTELKPFNPKVEFFMFAYYPGIHKEPTMTAHDLESWQSDVLFVGSRYVHREGLLTQLVSSVNAKYAIYGHQWHKTSKRSPLLPYIKSRPLYGEDMAKAIRGAKITLGFLAKENRDDYTQRTFEIPACGGLMLMERTARQQAFFEEGIEAEFFDADDIGELCQKVSTLLRDDLRREAIRQGGITALHRQQHTYRDRLNRLIQLYRMSRV